MLRLAGPVIFMQAIHVAFQVVDLAWVGRLGAAASGAVSIGFFVSWIVFALAEGVGIGIVAQVSRAVGGNRLDRAGEAATQGVLVGLGVGILLAAGGPFLLPVLFGLLETPPEVSRLGSSYLAILFLGGPALLTLVAVESVWRAAGDTVTPMWIMGAASVLNALLDPFLIFGIGPFPALGVEGAALASVIAWTLGLVAFVAAARRRPILRFGRWDQLRPDWGMILMTIRIGLPRFLLGSLYAGVYLFLSALTARIGVAALAVLGIVNRMESVVYLVSDGAGVATATLVGQNLGAAQPERAERATHVAAWTAIALSLGPTVAMLFAPAALLGLFIPDPEVVAAGITYTRVLGLCQVFMALEIVMANGFSGAGDTTPPLLVEIPIAAARVPLSWLVALPLGFGLIGVGWVLSITCILRGVWMTLWFRGGRWKRRQV